MWGKVGSFAAAQVHNEVREDLRDSDAGRISKTFDAQILAPVTAFNFGPEVRAPHLHFDISEPEDKEKTVEVLKGAREMGLAIPTHHVYQVLGIPAPESGDEVLPLPDGGQAEVAQNKAAASIQLNSFDGPDPESQWAIDQLAELALADAGLAMPDLLEPMKEAIQRAAGFEEAEVLVLRFFPGDTLKGFGSGAFERRFSLRS